MGRVAPHRILNGKVMHKRLTPRVNQFVYGQYYVCLAISQLEKAVGPLFSMDGFNVFSVMRKDHGPQDGSDLYAWCREALEKNGLDTQWMREVHLITQPRLLGWVFNPVSFWLCEDEENNIRAVLAEVSNTFGERHTYLIHHKDLSPLRGEDEIVGKKLLYVSPFFEVEGEYVFRFQRTENSFGVWIDYYVEGERQLLTSLVGDTRAELRAGQLMKLFCKIPLANMKTFILIHYQALKLWLKKIKLTHRDPFAGPEVSTCTKQIRHQD